MELKTNAANRKDVVKALSEFLGVPSEYQGPPTFGYTVGEVTVDREGKVHIEDEGKGEEIRTMLTENTELSDEKIDELVDAFMNALPALLKTQLQAA